MTELRYRPALQHGAFGQFKDVRALLHRIGSNLPQPLGIQLCLTHLFCHVRKNGPIITSREQLRRDAPDVDQPLVESSNAAIHGAHQHAICCGVQGSP